MAIRIQPKKPDFSCFLSLEQLQKCLRCGGTGYFSCYKHIENGILALYYPWDSDIFGVFGSTLFVSNSHPPRLVIAVEYGSAILTARSRSLSLFQSHE